MKTFVAINNEFYFIFAFEIQTRVYVRERENNK